MKPPFEQEFLDALNQNIGIVHRVCISFFASPADEREDLFQEVIYQLWKSYPSFNGESKFTTWMYKVALNTAVTYIRQSRRSPVKERLSEEHYQIADVQDSDDHDEQVNLLYSAIHTLGNIDKAIILLYLDDHSYEEIADITGLTKSNVSVRLVRIKRTLEERLKHAV